MANWDEETVALEMNKALGNDPEDDSLKVRDLGHGVDGWTVEDGNREYIVFADSDEAEKFAVDQVENDLDDDPSMFNQDWIRDHLVMSETDRRVYANDESDSYANDIDDDRAVEEAGMEDEFAEAEDAGEDTNAIVTKAREAVQEQRYDEIYKALEDPISYFIDDNGLYDSVEDLIKSGIVSIHSRKAAEDAVNTDGVAHFLATYDGEENETDGGLVYYRTN